MLAAGQPVMRTVPALTTAAAMNGTALDRSGSMCQCRAATTPGRTCQRLGVVVRRPRRRLAGASPRSWRCAARTVVAGPVCCTIRPSVNDAPDSSRPDTNCDDAEASMSTAPPATDPAPCTRNGNPSPSMSTPRPRSASSNGAIGRTRACSSPSKVTAATPKRRQRRDETQHRAGQAAVDPGVGCRRDRPADSRARPLTPRRAGPTLRARRSSGRCRGCAVHR